LVFQELVTFSRFAEIDNEKSRNEKPPCISEPVVVSTSHAKLPTDGQHSLSVLQLALYFVAFGLASIGPVLLAPSLLTGQPLDSLDKTQLLAIALMAASYAAGLLLLFLLLVFRKALHYLYKPLFIIVIFGASFFLLYAYQNQEIAFLVTTTLLLTGLCLWLFQKAVAFPLSILAALTAVAGILIWLTDFDAHSQRASGKLVKHTSVQTLFYNLKITTFPGRIRRSIKGGVLTYLGDDYLLATGDGRLYSISYGAASDLLETQLLPYSAPINAVQFRNDATKKVDTNKFRVTDIYAQQLPSGYRVFVAHHFWKSEQQCFLLRLSTVEGSAAELISGTMQQDWQTVFETSPCLPLKDSGHAFAGHQAGGRIDMLDEKTVILTVGDHSFDGNASKLILPQDDSSSYGKSLLIDVASGSAAILSKGHRNPQGLHVDSGGLIWSTEHGPRGGDELNLLDQDKNYGWPLETYGIAYGKPVWPLSTDQGRHRKFQAPAYAWVPSIGISNLISVGPAYFSLWESDLIVSSMARKSLFRIRVDDGLVRYAEEIKIGQRIRDLIEGHDGQLILWTDKSALITVAKSAQTGNGQQSFAVCSGCHAINDGNTHIIGPDLYGIGGKRPGTADDFEYSETLRNLSTRWNRETLDRYLENPESYAPGTSMIFAGVPDAAQRKILIDYLLNDGHKKLKYE